MSFLPSFTSRFTWGATNSNNNENADTMDPTEDPQPPLNTAGSGPVPAVKSESLPDNVLPTSAVPAMPSVDPPGHAHSTASTPHSIETSKIKADPETATESPLATAPQAPSQQVLQPKRETTTEPEEEPQDTNYLQRLLTRETPEILEAGVKIGTDLLDNLAASLTLENLDAYPDAKAWKRSVEELKEQAKPTKTIVGVVGNTGAGKSSVVSISGAYLVTLLV
jgi:hypothetical protein